MRLSLHPDGLASRIVNVGQIRAHLLHTAQRQADATGDPVLRALCEEISSYPAPPDATDQAPSLADSVDMQLRLREQGVLSFISTITVFGTPLDITLAELAIESFFPADARTAAVLRASLPD